MTRGDPPRHAKKPRVPRWVAGAAVAVVAAVVAVALVLTLHAGPSYPFGWCGPVIHQISTVQPDDAYQAAMSQLGPKARSILADQMAFQKASGDADAADNLTAPAATAAALLAARMVQADLDVLTRMCHVRSGSLDKEPHSAW
jgi:hypothetical protein